MRRLQRSILLVGGSLCWRLTYIMYTLLYWNLNNIQRCLTGSRKVLLKDHQVSQFVFVSFTEPSDHYRHWLDHIRVFYSKYKLVWDEKTSRSNRSEDSRRDESAPNTKYNQCNIALKPHVNIKPRYMLILRMCYRSL